MALDVLCNTTDKLGKDSTLTQVVMGVNNPFLIAFDCDCSIGTWLKT